MAIDTIKLKKYITEEMAMRIQNCCIKRMAFEIGTGDIQYEITTGSLEGTYDSKISVRVERDIDWYVTVECSIHKLILGHNVFGGTDDLQASVYYLQGKLQEILKMSFPFKSNEWQLMRIDIAEIYELDSFEAVQEWFRAINTCQFPRRVVQRYGTHGIAAYGSVTGIKGYHKGPDFWKHDRKRLKDNGIDVEYLQERANKILRVEVEVKGRKLKDMYNREYPLIGQINMKHMNAIHDREVGRFLKEGKSDMQQVKNTLDVKARLFNTYSDKLASALLATWYQLTTLGEDDVKRTMKKANYYKHIKLLKEAGISWHGTDIIMLESTLVPSDFIPMRTDIRRVSGESQEMEEKLRKYRQRLAIA